MTISCHSQTEVFLKVEGGLLTTMPPIKLDCPRQSKTYGHLSGGRSVPALICVISLTSWKPLPQVSNGPLRMSQLVCAFYLFFSSSKLLLGPPLSSLINGDSGSGGASEHHSCCPSGARLCCGAPTVPREAMEPCQGAEHRSCVSVCCFHIRAGTGGSSQALPKLTGQALQVLLHTAS